LNHNHVLMVLFALGFGTMQLFAADGPTKEVSRTGEQSKSPLDTQPQPWQRRAQPIISALTTKQPWCKVVVYSPRVALVGGVYRMWYCGTSTGSRAGDCSLGYAESADGIDWKESPDNPIVRADKIGWGSGFWNPCVRFDEEEKVYKMWFSSNRSRELNAEGRLVKIDMALGYATSPDGKHWKIYPEPIHETGFGPCVIKTGPDHYRMWMNSPGDNRNDPAAMYQNIHSFNSRDGIHWKRDNVPAIQPTHELSSSVYPWVIRDGGRYILWHAGHVPGGRFEIFAATSPDGIQWTPKHEQAAFPATGGRNDFDGRYTSTPCVLALKDRYLLYYSSRDGKPPTATARGEFARTAAASIPTSVSR